MLKFNFSVEDILLKTLYHPVKVNIGFENVLEHSIYC